MAVKMLCYVLKKVKTTVAVLVFFDLQKGSVTSNQNNLASYAQFWNQIELVLHTEMYSFCL